MQEDVFIGTIMLFGFPRVPTGWAACNGQLLAVAENDVLFALIGTTYGGDGRTTFALPDLRGRLPLHQGTGPGLSSYRLGQDGGAETVSLTQLEMPAHRHALVAAAADPASGPTATPGPQVTFATAVGTTPYVAIPTAPTPLAAQTVGASGGSRSHDNMMPSLVMNYCIALQGLWPSQN